MELFDTTQPFARRRGRALRVVGHGSFAMADTSAHAAFLATQFSSSFSRLLYSHNQLLQHGLVFGL
jgi:hypothetical protein